ncbi:hypothetical protein TNIN_79471 [Trichonephila inaurata madagascariensis]|uniref:Uncharacterized protein n=1 Tax=Trichonephila inaurata madagascariensis TaxID=2747483 RepID=A0A8X6XW45_9ARAC|nr:hypothetical protein TNIN_79471 [Trichonephila inaurata madagascariensis]
MNVTQSFDVSSGVFQNQMGLMSKKDGQSSAGRNQGVGDCMNSIIVTRGCLMRVNIQGIFCMELNEDKPQQTPLVPIQFASSVYRNQNRLGQNCTRGVVVSGAEDDVGKGVSCDHPHSPTKFQGDGQCVQQQIVTNQGVRSSSRAHGYVGAHHPA